MVRQHRTGILLAKARQVLIDDPGVRIFRIRSGRIDAKQTVMQWRLVRQGHQSEDANKDSSPMLLERLGVFVDQLNGRRAPRATWLSSSPILAAIHLTPETQNLIRRFTT